MKSPFGGSRWQPRSFDADVDALEGEGAEDAEETPRRRRGATEPSPYPRKTVAALGAKAKVVRDASGVPHIQAKTERDAYAALGFCMAEDRLWQLDVLRRIACGRAAEILGAPFVRHDALVRTVGVPRRAGAAATRLEGVARDVLAAFVGGINAVRADVKPPECVALGYEIEPWTIADSLAIELYTAWMLSLETWPHKLLLARALAGAGLERARWIAPPGIELGLVSEQILALWRRIDLRVLDWVASAPGAASGGGSNAWAVGRDHTATGAALVAGDPHLRVSLPSVMYLAHLEAPGFSIAGAAFVGGPVLQVGRSQHCAWSVTNFSLDDVDCVIEELDGIGNFRTEKGWAPLNRRSELVRVRDGESVKIEVAETRNGPLLSHLIAQLDTPHAEAGELALAVRWGVNSLGTALPGWLALARATSVAQAARAAATMDKGPLALNVVVGDTAGEVGHFGVGGLPMRDAQARLPVRGWLGEARWTAVTGLSTITSRQASDAAVSANEAHLSGATARYPAHAYADHPYRARRIREQIDAGTCRDVAGALALQRDVVDLAARELLPVLKGALARPELGDHVALARIAPALAEWDGAATADSAAAAVFYVALASLAPRELFPENRFGPLARFWRQAWWGVTKIFTATASPWFASDDERDRALLGILNRAAAWCADRMGDDTAAWTWGALHELALHHPLSFHETFATGVADTWPAPGSPFTVLQHRWSDAHAAPPFPVVLGPAVRMVADLATDEVHLVLPGGESGRIEGGHLLDQVQLWRTGGSVTVKLQPETTGDITELVPG
jgi:penicillin amidase